MRHVIASLTLVGIMVASATWSDAQDTPTTTLPLPNFETTTKGQASLGAGRWLVLADLDLQGRRRTVPSFWETKPGPSGLELHELFVDPPESVKASLDAVTGTGVIWTPTEAELAAIDEAWIELTDTRRGVATVKSEIWGSDAFDDDIKAEESMKDAIWVVRQTYDFVPGGSRPVRQVNIYGALGPEGRGFTGNYSAVAVAAAPFPIPISYHGTFRMLAIGPEPAPKGFLARLADVFSGCGR